MEELIKGYGDMGEFYRTPPLGQHFAIRWDMAAVTTAITVIIITIVIMMIITMANT